MWTCWGGGGAILNVYRKAGRSNQDVIPVYPDLAVGERRSVFRCTHYVVIVSVISVVTAFHIALSGGPCCSAEFVGHAGTVLHSRGQSVVR